MELRQLTTDHERQIFAKCLREARATRGFGFKDADRKTFPERGEDEGIGLCEKWLNVGNESCEVDTRSDTEGKGLMAQCVFIGAGAEDGELGMWGQMGKSAK